ncbi:MAG: hypothetical protein U9R02_03105 [Thermodesulfobacteriota bacterium]|nr:hypothetical protein [Thermodesulfobacteriota bacterium]
MAILANDLKEKGPEQPAWQNYSKLRQNTIVIWERPGWLAGNIKTRQQL